MKIGFYSPYLDTYGGGERYILTLAAHLSQNTQNQVEIFWDDPTVKAPLSRFLKIDLTNARFVPNIFNEISIINKTIKTRQYDVMFILSDGSIPVSLAKTNILHFQVPFHFRKRDVKTKLKLARYKHIICNSFFTKVFIDASFQVNSKVIYPPVDILSVRPLRKEQLILSVGRFSPNQLHPKKQEILIEVFKELYKKEPAWKLLLVGQAKKEDHKYIRNLKRISKGYAIKIIENLEIEKLMDLYGKATIYWHATGFGEEEMKNPEKMEHFGISTVEASAAGCVPVVIGKGGQKEIIEDNRNGLLWTTKTQLLEKTLKLISDQRLIYILSKNAVKNSKRFSQQRFFEQYEKIIY